MMDMPDQPLELAPQVLLNWQVKTARHQLHQHLFDLNRSLNLDPDPDHLDRPDSGPDLQENISWTVFTQAKCRRSNG